MIVKKEYRKCDRCHEVINEHWYKLARVGKFKKRLLISGYVHESEFDLCGICSEKLERFMDKELDDDKPTEYEQYHAKD